MPKKKQTDINQVILSTQFYKIEDDASFSTLVELFHTSIEKYASRVAFRMKVGTRYNEITYAEFGEMAHAIAKYLRSIGIHKRKFVGIISENRPQWGIVYFAILLTGAAVVPIDALLSENEVEHIINESGLSCLFCSGTQYDKIGEISGILKSLKNIVVFDDVVNSSRHLHTLQEVLQKGRALKKEKPVKIVASDLAALIYTSGTTGSSKGVMLLHDNIASNVRGLRRMISFGVDDTFLSVLPLHHTFECTTGLIIPLSKGSSITTAESLASKKIIANIKETKVTIMMGVPLLFEKMVLGLRRGISEKPFHVRVMFKAMMGLVKGVKKAIGKNYGHKVFKSLRDKAGLGSLKIMISGGAPLQAWIGHTFEHLGIHFLNGYGLTETSPVLTVNIAADIDNATVGFPVDGIELALHEPNENGVGELKARGPFVMKGYYKNKKATAEVIRDGWLHTGDLARFDSKGRVAICGRSKNLIVTAGGKNVYPEEIELKLNSSDYILESLVLGRQISAQNQGEDVVVIIVPDYEFIENEHGAGTKSDAIEQLICKEVQSVNEMLVSYKRVKDLFIREEEFPKTSTRKIKRYLFQNRDISV